MAIHFLIDAAYEGIPFAKRAIAESLQTAQQTILKMTAVSKMEYRDPITGKAEEVALETLGGDDSVETTTTFLAVTAMSCLAKGAIDIRIDDILDLIHYWIDHDDCLILPEWPFSKEIIKEKHRRDEVSS